MPEHFHPVPIHDQPPRQSEVDEFLKNCDEQSREMIEDFKDSSDEEVREYVILNISLGRYPAKVEEFYRRFRPQCLPEKIISELRALAKDSPDEFYERLYELAKNNSSFRSEIEYGYKAGLRTYGYFTDLPSIEDQSRARKHIFKQVIDHPEIPFFEAYRDASWNKAEKVYYENIIKGGRAGAWGDFTPAEQEAALRVIKDELDSGTMPFHVREYLSIGPPEFLSARLVEQLRNPDTQERRVPGYKNLGQLEQEWRKTSLEEIEAELQRIVDFYPRTEGGSKQIKKYILSSMFSGRFDKETLEKSAVFKSLLPTSTEFENYERQLEEKIAMARERMALPGTTFQDLHNEIFKIVQPDPKNPKLYTAYTDPTESSHILSALLPECSARSGFLTNVPWDLPSTIREIQIPNFRQTTLETCAALATEGVLTPEIISAFLPHYDDALLQELWKNLGQNPVYAEVILGRIQNDVLRERLFEEAGVAEINVGAVERMVEYSKKIAEESDHIMSLEGYNKTSSPEYLQRVKNREAYIQHAARYYSSYKKILERTVPMYSERGSFLTPLDLAGALSQLALTNHAELAEKVTRDLFSELKRKDENLAENPYLYQKILSTLLSRSHPEHKAEVEAICTDLLKNNSVAPEDAQTLLTAWRVSVSHPDYRHVLAQEIQKNIETTIFLQEENPEAIHTLIKTFNIKNVGRYGDEILGRQLREKNVMGKRYVAVAFSEADWNGAFYKDKELLQGLMEKLAEHDIVLRVIEFSSVDSFVKQSLKLKKTYGPTALPIIGGHGSENGIQLGNEHEVKNPLLTKEMLSHPTAKRMEEWMEPGAQVILFSCSTGAKDGFAQALSNLYEHNVEVVGPDQPTSPKSLKLISVKPLKLEVEYHAQGSTQRFQRGAIL